MPTPPAPINPTPEPMTPVDRAWLEMDGPRNPMVVASIMDFEDVTDPEALASAFADRLAREPRFRQRVVETRDGRAWIEDDTLHAGYHVQVRYPEGRESQARLQAAVAAELSQPLDRALPLWRICLFVRHGGRATLLFRAHHCIADGVALMQGLLHLGDGNGRIAAFDNGDSAGAAAPARWHGPLGGVIHGLEAVNALLENLTEVVLDDLRHPDQLAQQVGDAGRALAAVSRVLRLPNDNPRRFRVAPRGKRAVAWTSSLSFPAVKRLARAQGVTINDVFLAALAGAFGRYLRGVERKLPETQNLRVSVPVNLRAPGDDRPGNSFGLVLVDLPVGLEGWHARLDVVSERMANLKKSPEARATLGALAIAGHLPVGAEKRLVKFVGGKAAAVVSNLPGPKRALRIGGARLANMVFWPPQTGDIGIGVSFLSYAGHVTVGVSADTAHVAKPQELIDAFRAELKAMLGRSPDVRPTGRSRRPRHPLTARSSTGVHHGKT
jgi:diacylglycerol O-acyltransferase / wax synthase